MRIRSAVGEDESLEHARLAAVRGRLLEWLTGSACPLWSVSGIDAASGGFVEALDAGGKPLALPRRVRVQPRQAYSFARAAGLGWRGDASAIVRAGLEYLVTRYQRPDGLFRTLITADGGVLDDSAWLYDHAFVLLGYSAAAALLDERGAYEARALELRGRIERAWRREDGAFVSGEGAGEARDANPHMHLLEASLAWAAIGQDPGWAERAEFIATLALERFTDPRTGALTESFTPDWRPAPTDAGRRVEPGHQYEWAWLLLRCDRADRPERRAGALHLIDVAERAGVHGGLAVNALDSALEVRDANARLWPQTERLKAALLAESLTGLPMYATIAANAASELMKYLDTDVAGVWFDERLPDGQFRVTPAPASTLYHLIGAVEALCHGRRVAGPVAGSTRAG